MNNRFVKIPYTRPGTSSFLFLEKCRELVHAFRVHLLQRLCSARACFLFLPVLSIRFLFLSFSFLLDRSVVFRRRFLWLDGSEERV